MEKLKYTEALPGFGSKGLDGSIGLSGLSSYFCEFDGESAETIIRSKIIENKELNDSGNHIPDYPLRSYQTGDIIIDKNSKIFQINLSSEVKYEYTNMEINNTSSFFVYSEKQEMMPFFNRYTNSISPDFKFLIDTVYTIDEPNFLSNPPLGVYGSKSLYYAKINHVDHGLVGYGGIGDFYPYQLWNTGIKNNDNHMALSREKSENVWHLGNLVNNVVREIDLDLDFKNIKIGEKTLDNKIIVHGNTLINSDVDVSGNVSFYTNVTSNIGTSDNYINGSVYADSLTIDNLVSNGDIDVSGGAQIQGNFIINDGSIQIGGVTSDTNHPNNIVSGDIFANHVQNIAGGNITTTSKAIILGELGGRSEFMGGLHVSEIDQPGLSNDVSVSKLIVDGTTEINYRLRCDGSTFIYNNNHDLNLECPIQSFGLLTLTPTNGEPIALGESCRLQYTNVPMPGIVTGALHHNINIGGDLIMYVEGDYTRESAKIIANTFSSLGNDIDTLLVGTSSKIPYISNTIDIKFPVNAYFRLGTHATSGQLQTMRRGTWFTETAGVSNSTVYGIVLYPGKYRIIMDIPGGNTWWTECSLYASGAYGVSNLNKIL